MQSRLTMRSYLEIHGWRAALVLIGVGLVAVGIAVALALWPMQGNGLTGSAVRPHYGPFGWYSYTPLPAHPTTADFRKAGIPVPQDLVAARRRVVEQLAACGALVIAIGAVTTLAARRAVRTAG